MVEVYDWFHALTVLPAKERALGFHWMEAGWSAESVIKVKIFTF
jgi:hypothetical protein